MEFRNRIFLILSRNPGVTLLHASEHVSILPVRTIPAGRLKVSYFYVHYGIGTHKRQNFCKNWTSLKLLFSSFCPKNCYQFIATFLLGRAQPSVRHLPLPNPALLSVALALRQLHTASWAPLGHKATLLVRPPSPPLISFVAPAHTCAIGWLIHCCYNYCWGWG